MTFSLVGRCAQSGQLGMVISSSSPAVAARCAHVRAGVGVVATQNVTNPALGPLTLDSLAQGLGSTGALAASLGREPFADYRQILVLNGDGEIAMHSGAQALGIWSSAQGTDCASGGNLLADAAVPAAMVRAFEQSTGALCNRLLGALRAGAQAGGEAGPVHSAGLLVADKHSWPYVDLRVDWHDDPITALEELWAVYAPQADAYVTRALDPTAAPSYGVPGDL